MSYSINIVYTCHYISTLLFFCTFLRASVDASHSPPSLEYLRPWREGTSPRSPRPSLSNMEIDRSPDKHSVSDSCNSYALHLGEMEAKKSCQMLTSSSKANIIYIRWATSYSPSRILICIFADRFFVWTSYFLQAPNDFQRQRVLFGESCGFHRGRRMKKQNLSEAMILKSIFPALSWQVIGNLLEENFIKIHPCWKLVIFGEYLKRIEKIERWLKRLK